MKMKMKLFHINTKDYTVSECNYKVGECPYGGCMNHYLTEEEAVKVRDQKMITLYGILPNLKKVKIK